MNVQHQFEDIIFTGNISVSHIRLYLIEPEVTLFALFGNVVSGEMEEINILCDFNQLNNLIAVSEDGSEEAVRILSDLIAEGNAERDAIDLTESGGLHFCNILFCLEKAEHEPNYDEENDEHGQDSIPTYIIRDFITEGIAIKAFEKMFSYRNRHSKFEDYALSLIIQYAFFRRFKKHGLKQSKILKLSLLSDPINLMMAAQYYDSFERKMEDRGKKKKP